MAGIYIHIPFCRRACHYCNFHFSTSSGLQNDFVKALLKEMSLRKNYAGDEPVETIYFGGGTPSLLTEPQLAAIMEGVNEFKVCDGAEISFEANPDDITAEKLNMWKGLGINRLSIGVQSFSEQDLLWMNRAHTAAQAAAAIDLARESGIGNLSIDLIYGTPGLSDTGWEENMRRAAGLQIPHLSCYALTVEPGTALDAMTRKKRVQAVSSEDQARQFLMMTDFLQGCGYDHYEISNLSMPGRRSQHNSAYWNGAKYLGLGPSAHSFDGHSRQWNVSNNALYIQALHQDHLPFEAETLTDAQRFNEYVMTALRKMEGVDVGRVRKKFGNEYADNLLLSSEKFIEKNWIGKLPERLVLTREGKLFSDLITAELFA